MATTQQFSWPSSADVTITGIGNPTGQPVPLDAVYLGGKNPEGNLTGVAVNDAGQIITTPATGSQTHVIVDSSALPAGAATSANQATEISSQATIATNTTGVSTASLQTTGNSSLATIATNTTNLTETETAPGTSASFALTVQGNTSGIPIPVSISGSTDDANINIDKYGGTATTLGLKAAAASIPVVIASDQVVPISATTLPLPTGAATEATLAAASAKLPATLGQKTSAVSLAVVLPSDQAPLPAQTGRSVANAPIQNIYSTTNITTAAYVQLIASTSNQTNYLDIFDSSGQAMILAVGTSGSEVIQAYISPGGAQIPLLIPVGSRVAYKALSANATAGYLLVSLYE